MPAPALEDRGTIDSSERKRRLVQLCAGDRSAWVAACRTRRKPATLVSRLVLEWGDLVGLLIPGRIGRWIRGASHLAGIVRQVGRSLL